MTDSRGSFGRRLLLLFASFGGGFGGGFRSWLFGFAGCRGGRFVAEDAVPGGAEFFAGSCVHGVACHKKPPGEQDLIFTSIFVTVCGEISDNGHHNRFVAFAQPSAKWQVRVAAEDYRKTAELDGFVADARLKPLTTEFPLQSEIAGD